MKIVVIPLDERPCNCDYLKELPLPKGIELVLPGEELLSKKKISCNYTNLEKRLLDNTKDADYLIVSFDTLLYGGIIPSRIQNLELNEILDRSKIIYKIKENNPNIKIFANNLIMRCPSYDSSDEEPDYYENFGYSIFRYGQLVDKESHDHLNDEEIAEKKQLEKKIGKSIIEDFVNRREKNITALLNNIKFVKDGLIDFFVIPQDDCSELGFTAIDQRKVRKYIYDEKLEDKVIIYPGADEIGLTLIARVLNDYFKKKTKFFVFYSSNLGKNAIPMFEDRPISETIKYHIYAVNGLIVSNISEADVCLGVNLGSEFLDKNDKRWYIAYGKNRNILSFVDTINYILSLNKYCGIADCAYCNEADHELIRHLNKKDLLFKISSYAGWNTSSNTLGTAIANLISYYYSQDEVRKNFSLYYRYVDDYIYMANVRSKLNEQIVNEHLDGVTKFNLGNQKEKYTKICEEKIMEESNNFSKEFASHINNVKIDFIRNRTFEIRILLDLK